MARPVPIKIPEKLSGEDQVSPVSVDGLAILDSLKQAILVLDCDGGFCYANLATEELLLRSAATMRRVGPLTLFNQSAALATALAHVNDTGISAYLEASVIGRMPGEDIHLDIHLMPLVGASTRDGKAQIILQLDGTEMGRPRGGPNIAPDTRSFAGMAAVLAHEVKNPLAGIRGSAQLLDKNANGSDQRLTRIIMDECDRVRGLIDSMEGFSNPRSGDVRPTNIHELLDHVVALSQASSGPGVVFERVYDPSLPEIVADRDGLVQVFLNLLKNAAEVVDPEHGRITVQTAYRHGSKVQGTASSMIVDAPIEVRIRDNGPGIAPEFLDCLFEPFITSKRAGQGLGLALSKKIVRDHSGLIKAENTSTGAVLSVLLPLGAKRAEIKELGSGNGTSAITEGPDS